MRNQPKQGDTVAAYTSPRKPIGVVQEITGLTPYNNMAVVALNGGGSAVYTLASLRKFEEGPPHIGWTGSLERPVPEFID